VTVFTVNGRSRILVATRVPVIDSAARYSLVGLALTENSGSVTVSSLGRVPAGGRGHLGREEGDAEQGGGGEEETMGFHGEAGEGWGRGRDWRTRSQPTAQTMAPQPRKARRPTRGLGMAARRMTNAP
jgi:hypothetical protein